MKKQGLNIVKQIFMTVFMLFTVNTLFAQTKINVLVFSKTAAFRHQSIEAGKTALAKMAKRKKLWSEFYRRCSSVY